MTCWEPMEPKLTAGMVSQISDRMKELVSLDLPITKKSYPLDEARAIFRKYKMLDKEKLFRFRRSSSVNVYCLDG